MGRRGPAPKPTTLRVLNGDHPSRVNHDEPRPREGVPAPPDWFGPRELTIWKRVVTELTAMGMARPVDQDMIATYCCAVLRWSDATKILNADGLIIRKTEWKAHPAVAIVDTASREMSRLAREFGFTPAARVGITATAAAGGHRPRTGADPERILG